MYLWDDPTQAFTPFEWKSKGIRTQDYMNLGAARVIADFSRGSGVSAASILAKNIRLIADQQVGGAVAGNGDRFGPSATSTQNDIGASLAGVPLSGSRLRPIGSISASLTFTLYVNGVLAHSTPVFDDSPFRLPTGYRMDKFEVSISGNAPVRAVQLAETPQGLKAV
jgi:hypothetical protein